MTDSARALMLAAVLGGCAALASCAPGPDPTRGVTAPGPSGIRYLAADDDATGFALATTPPSYFVFPRDHQAHPDYRTEWWYFTGNVFDDAENHYGFELTIFRIALTPETPLRESSFATNEIWMAHLAITDTRRELFQVAERLSRGASGLAGVSTATGSDGESVIVSVEDFEMRFLDDEVTLIAQDRDFGIELTLRGLLRIVAQGNNGLDAKGPEPGNASYYFSAPRLAVAGELRSARELPVAVRGSAWLDREWSTSALSPDIEGWDWFALQLDDGRDLMFYRLRRQDGSTSGFSGGSITSAAGSVRRLEADSVVLEVTREWTSAATGVRYPVGWRMAIPEQALDLEISPRLDAQEIDLTVRYWEGAVTVDGTTAGAPVRGVGYLELAGY